MGCMQYKQSDCPGQRTHPDITSTRHGAAIFPMSSDPAVAARGTGADAPCLRSLSLHPVWHQISNAEQRAARTPPAATHAQGPRGHRQVPPPHPEPARPQGQNRTNGTSDYSGFWLWLPCDGKLHHRIGGRHRSCGQRCEPHHHHRCVRRSRCNSSAPFSNCFSVCFGDVFGFLGHLTSNY